VPTELHQRSPFFVGSSKMMEELEACSKEATATV
jgi:fructose-1,6-bisphosphatase I